MKKYFFILNLCPIKFQRQLREDETSKAAKLYMAWKWCLYSEPLLHSSACFSSARLRQRETTRTNWINLFLELPWGPFEDMRVFKGPVCRIYGIIFCRIWENLSKTLINIYTWVYKHLKMRNFTFSSVGASYIDRGSSSSAMDSTMLIYHVCTGAPKGQT